MVTSRCFVCSPAASASLKAAVKQPCWDGYSVAGHRQQRLPGRVGGRVGITVLVGVPDRCDRTPELIEELRVEAGDPGVGSEDHPHSEQMCSVDEV
jgi:hypothetical protein